MNRPVQQWAVEAAALISQSTGYVLQPRYHASTEAKSACPFCKTGDDRFVIFQEGNYWCRQCHVRGWWRTKLSSEEINEIETVKIAERQATTRKLSTCQDWKIYHREVAEHVSDWETHGINTDDIKRWQLGYSKNHFSVPSLTIPVFRNGVLVDIRHRLLQVEDGAKYRSHFKNTPPVFFNADVIETAQKVFLVEGEKKAIIMSKFGFNDTISYPGINTQEPLLSFLHNDGHAGQEFIYIPDPNTIDTVLQAGRELKALGHKVSVIELFLKPDDMLLQFGVQVLKSALTYTRKL